MMNFYIIGAGRRVQQDLIPVLKSMGVRSSLINIYAKNKKTIFVKDELYIVNKLNFLQKIEDNSIVYIAVPPNASEFILKKIIDINNNSKIIIDTPIINKSIIKLSKKKYWVAEDAYNLGKLLSNNLNLKRFNLLFFQRSFFSYHGVAFVESILSTSFFIFSILGIRFMFCKKGIAVIIGKRQYERGNIYLNFNKIYFPKLNQKEINLIGGLSDYDSLSYRFLELKRLGLRDLVSDVILSNEKNLINLKVAYTQFLKSNKMTKYSLGRISYLIYKKFF